MSTVRHQFTPEELRQRLAAERSGLPFLVYRDATGAQRVLTLRDETDRVTLGRGEACDARLELDPEVSRLHAELQRIGDNWLIADDGLSRNGTFVNGDRVVGRRRLSDRDVVRCGATWIAFHDPFRPTYETTRPAGDLTEARLSEGQRRVLIALCRPLRDGDPYAMPASNKVIAEELFLSVAAVKGHLRTLFEKLAIEDLPNHQKRLRLVERALETGTINSRELF